MDTLEHIAINPTRVPNAEGPTTAQIVSSKKKRRRNAPCAEETTMLTTKDANTTIILSKETTPTESPSKLQSTTHGHLRANKTQPNLPLQQRSYAEAVRNDTQQAEEPLTAIKVFFSRLQRTLRPTTTPKQPDIKHALHYT